MLTQINPRLVNLREQGFLSGLWSVNWWFPIQSSSAFWGKFDYFISALLSMIHKYRPTPYLFVL